MMDNVILSIQVGGFMFALASLFYPGQPMTSILFPIGFGIHLVGDLIRLKVDGKL